MKVLRSAATLGLVMLAVPAMAQTVEQKRKLYALMETASSYCPNIEVRFGAQGLLDYDMGADGEYEQYKKAEQHWYDLYRSAGSRTLVCNTLMNEYGPGSNLHVLEFK